MKIKLYTDGSCLGNPGPGGWGYVLEYGDYRKFGADSMLDTTNNRQELYAVIHGLQAIKDKSIPVEVITDSKYVVRGVNEWIEKWKANNWKNSRGKQVTNKDLWEVLDTLLAEFDEVSFTWVKGHNGNMWNEYADELAYTAAGLAQKA